MDDLWMIKIMVLGGSSHLVSGLVHPCYKWDFCRVNPVITGFFSPTYDSWDEPPSRPW